ncbi:MAG: hypothetical protein ABNH21_17370 [Glaciecola sp.]|jgi:hypothetical protein
MENNSLKIIEELRVKQAVESFPFTPNTTQFVFPAASSYSQLVVKLIDTKCLEKKILFSALYTASYVANYTDRSALSYKRASRQYGAIFIDYLNKIDINETNRLTILKDFEANRVKSDGVKTQSTGLRSLIRLINISLDYAPFTETIDSSQFNYLNTLTKTKVAPDDNKDAKTMTAWFSFHSWLRIEDFGIGNEKFNRLASPKALTKSLRITAEVALYSIQKAKYALIDFFKEQNIAPESVAPPRMSPNRGDMSAENYKLECNKFKKYIYPFIEKRFTFLHKAYLDLPSPSQELSLAFEIIIYSWCREVCIADSMQRFKNGQTQTYHFQNSRRFSVDKSAMFSHEFLYALADYAYNDVSSSLPVSSIEHVLFHWLMAYQSVQVSDITKLRLSNFRFVRRTNGRITHIESEYFKGRANDIHHLKSIKANTDMGKSILNFINDRTAEYNDSETNLTHNLPTLTTAKNGSIGQFIRLCARSSLREEIDSSLEVNKASSVYVDALSRIIENGIALKVYENRIQKSSIDVDYRQDWLLRCGTPKKHDLFGISCIKTSAIHARSDTFTPTQLQNYNSHTNDTERKNYLTEHNQEWLNNCGRITRAVMQDLHVNVFVPSKQKKQCFNSDFTRASEVIDMRCSNVLNRLRLVTRKDHGQVDELGFLKENPLEHADLPDTLYLLDSPETVMKFHHYVHEAEKKHKQLAIRSLDFLLFTVLPTVEWVSTLLAEKHFSKESLEKGKELFEQYAQILPPHFSAQLGGQ